MYRTTCPWRQRRHVLGGQDYRSLGAKTTCPLQPHLLGEVPVGVLLLAAVASADVAAEDAVAERGPLHGLLARAVQQGAPLAAQHHRGQHLQGRGGRLRLDKLAA